MATEDCCIVCADPLDWTGFGACGHKDTCSRCVARLRFVLEDKRCVTCRTELGDVFFTRFMGDYTARLTQEQFEELKKRAKAKEVYHLREVDGYFDDSEHFNYIRNLCSYTHPALATGPGADAPAFGSLTALQRRVAEQKRLLFCDLCLKGRKVFICEQALYTKPELNRHVRIGDDAGDMSEATGFSGHPACQFCRSRFYDSNELYRHMESAHEHCFICRRLNPDKYVYFRHYDELEEHFRSAHHPCPHPSCLERKFIVFGAEAELKRHFAAEHGDELRMSRAQRRDMLSVPIQLHFPSRAGGGRAGGGGDSSSNARGDAAALAAAMARPGVVIGGGAGLQQRGGRGGGGGSMRHSRSDPAMAAAEQASVESGRVEAAVRESVAAAGGTAGPGGGIDARPRPSSINFNALDFPAVEAAGGGGSGTSRMAPLGSWSGAGGGAGGGRGAGLTREDFPELPALSKAARKRHNQQQRSLAERLAGAHMNVRVLNSAAGRGGRAAAAPAAASFSGQTGAAVDEVASTSAAGEASIRPATAVALHHSRSLGELGPMGAAGESDAPGAGHEDDYPSLGPGSAAPAHPSWVPVRSRAPRPSSSSQRPPPRPPPGAAEFPALRGPHASSPLRQKPQQQQQQQRSPSKQQSPVEQQQQQAPAPAPTNAAGGVSEGLKAANKALMDKVKRQLDADAFSSFRQQSAAFMRDGASAHAYHAHIVDLGLLPLVPELAALCPDAARRGALVDVHRAFLASEDAQDHGKLGRSWVPPEAALAAAERAEQRASWECGTCTLVNAPNSSRCEACGGPRLAPGRPDMERQQQRQQEQQQVQPRAAAAASSSREAAGSPDRGSAAAARPGSNAGGGSSKPRVSSGVGSLAADAAAAAAPAPASSSAAWLSLAGPGPNSSVSDGPAAAAASAASGRHLRSSSTGAEDAGPSSTGAAAGTLPQKGKQKAKKMSLQEMMASGRVHPQNAWTQSRSGVRLPAPTAAAPQGQWAKKGGGAALAKRVAAVNDVWGE